MPALVVATAGSDARNLKRTADLQESHVAWAPTGELIFTRHADTGPIELWSVPLDDCGERRLETTVEPVFVFDWANR